MGDSSNGIVLISVETLLNSYGQNDPSTSTIVIQNPVINTSFPENSVHDNPINDTSFIRNSVSDKPINDTSFTENSVNDNPINDTSFIRNSVIDKPINDTSFTGNSVNDKPTKVKGHMPCPQCPCQFPNIDGLVHHIRKMHRGQKPYQCYMCDYGTVNSIMFKEHLLMHKGIKPYKCKFCDYHSASKKYMKKHELKHSQCNTCGMILKNLKQLEKHKESKCTGIKYTVYLCTNCKRKFDTERAFNIHNSNKSFCHLCSDVYCSKRENHMKKFHNDMNEKPLIFVCKNCGWTGTSEVKILLHLIHHPQKVENENIDVSVLKKYGILEE